MFDNLNAVNLQELPAPSVLQHLMLCFFSLLDEIVGNLGEGTFGKVVECLDHAR